MPTQPLVYAAASPFSVAAQLAGSATAGSEFAKKAFARVPSRLLQSCVMADIMAIFLSLSFSSWLRFETALAQYGHDAKLVPWTSYLGHAVFGTFLFIALLAKFEMYSLLNILRRRYAFQGVCKTAATWVALYLALSFLLRFENPVSRVFVLLATCCSTIALMGWRLVLQRAVSNDAIKQTLQKRTLFVGWSPQAESISNAIRCDPASSYKVVGFVHSQRQSGDRPADILQLGSSVDLAQILIGNEIDVVIASGMDPATDQALALSKLCEKEMVDFKIIPSCFEVLTSGLHLETFSGVPVLGISRLPLDEAMNLTLKRCVDVTGAIVGIGLSGPLVGLFSLLVYLESPGPIVYRQRRVGRSGKPFWILKIRSMKLNAEQPGKVGWTQKHDPRRLRVGAFMRKWNIDELPQFWNVLKGDMSLVGPRPERPELIRSFRELIPHYNARHTITPGITGWAQVNGLRGDTDLNERVKHDLYYIENWNPFLDFQIMVMTFIKRKNAC